MNEHRIELSKIEYILHRYSTISEAAVVVQNDLVLNKQSILAYIRPKKQIEKNILQYLSTQLTSYMSPSFIIPVEQFLLIMQAANEISKSYQQ